MSIFIALLRGINVGGKNKIQMTDLKKSFESLGLAKVQTYIQSGNVLFKSDENEAFLKLNIEKQINVDFGFSIRVILRTVEEFERLILYCPFSDNEIAAAETMAVGECLYVSFMAEEPEQDKVCILSKKEYYPDRYVIAHRDVYLLFHGSIRNAKLAADVQKLNPSSTTRNWKTVNKLFELAKAMI